MIRALLGSVLFLGGCVATSPRPSDQEVLAQIREQYGPEVAQCVAAMQYRPLPDHAQGVNGLLPILAAEQQNANDRKAAVLLCFSDPQAQLKPLPWEPQ